MNNDIVMIRRALLSVSDKHDLVELALFLIKFGVQILSTGGTAKALRENGLTVTDLSDYTGFPEGLDGRVKTLHPMVHGGLLYIRGNNKHEVWTREHGIKPIDLVVCNLYPFEQTIANPDVTFHQAIENIDIGGPSMLRSAAKNHDSVAAICEPKHYAQLQEQMIKYEGGTSLAFRRALAGNVFEHTGHYDTAIANYLSPTRP